MLFGAYKTLAKMHTQRTWHRSMLLNCENADTKQQYRIILVAIPSLVIHTQNTPLISIEEVKYAKTTTK